MKPEEQFLMLLEEIKLAKKEDEETLKVWKKANKRLTDANAAMQSFITKAAK